MTAPVPVRRERGMIFSAPMVRALIREADHPGTGKTQTRRVLKPPSEGMKFAGIERDGSWLWTRTCVYSKRKACYRVGDRLWVREAWSGPHEMSGIPPRDWLHGLPVWYWADGDPEDGDWTRPKPSIHMPRWASRLTLTVTDVRVERLQDISEADALAEGVECRSTPCSDGVIRNLWCGVWMTGHPDKPEGDGPVGAYRDLWESLHNPKSWCADDNSHAWSANPWVTALTLSVDPRNIDAEVSS